MKKIVVGPCLMRSNGKHSKNIPFWNELRFKGYNGETKGKTSIP